MDCRAKAEKVALLNTNGTGRKCTWVLFFAMHLERDLAAGDELFLGETQHDLLCQG